MTTAYQALNQTGGLQAVQAPSNNWLDPGVTSWTSTFAPGQVYENEGLGALMLRPKILDYLSQAGLSGDGLSMSVDKNGNPFTWNGYIMPASVTDPLEDKGYKDYLATYAGDRGTDKLANFLNEKNWGLRVGNNGTTYINQLYDKGTNQGLAADVRDERGSWLQQNGWMIPLAALGGIAAAGPTALGEGAVGVGSSGASITGGGISAGGGSGFGGGLLGDAGAGADPGAAAGGGGGGGAGGGGYGFGGEPIESITGMTPGGASDAALSAFQGSNLPPGWENMFSTAPANLGAPGSYAASVFNGSQALAPGWGTMFSTAPASLRSAGDYALGAFNSGAAVPSIYDAGASTGILDSIKNSAIGQAVGTVADAVGGGTNLAGLIGAGIGAASGGSGTNTATNQSKTDPRMDPYIYGDQGYLKALQNKYNANPSGINPLMQQALNIGTANLTDPAYAQTYQNMRNFGNGLLSQPLAGNPFTNGQGGQVQGLLSNFGGRAQSLIGQGGGLLGNSRQNQMQQPVTTGDGAHHMMAIRGGYVKG